MNWSKLAFFLCQVVIVISAAVGTSLATAQQQSCGFLDTAIRFKDGASDCIKNFELFNRQGLIEGRRERYRDVISGPWAVAATENPQLCPFASRIAWNLDQGGEAARAESECNKRLNERVAGLAREPKPVGCKCQVIAESGESPLTKAQFESRSRDYLTQLSRNNEPLGTPPIVIADPGPILNPAPTKPQGSPPSSPSPQKVPEPPTPTYVAARKALVVGIDRYRYMPTLTNGRSDASAMAAALRGLGFQVLTSVDTDLQSLKTEIASFAKTINKGDEVAFFFSGHGFGIDSGNYLAAADTKRDNEEIIKADSIELEWIKRRLKERDAKISLLVIDACRNDPRAVPLQTVNRSDLGGGLVPTTPAEGQAIIFSAGYGQKALDRLPSGDSNPNSVFTRIFLEEIVRPDIPIHQMLRKVRERVTETAASVNRRQVPAIYDEILGDFYFRKTR